MLKGETRTPTDSIYPSQYQKSIRLTSILVLINCTLSKLLCFSDFALFKRGASA